MTIDNVLTFVNQCGFPIACVFLLAMYIRDLIENHKREIDKLGEYMREMGGTHKEEVDKLNAIISENTQSINALKTEIEKLQLIRGFETNENKQQRD